MFSSVCMAVFPSAVTAMPHTVSKQGIQRLTKMDNQLTEVQGCLKMGLFRLANNKGNKPHVGFCAHFD
jgi:hypothetical protein